jgi:LacI family transcriptional regulator
LKRKPTLKDVANYAGVSTATVARVIHGNGYVAEETSKRVQAAIEITQYRINSIAQSLRQQRTYVIGHILQSTVPNPFFVQVALGAEQCALETGYKVLTYNVQGNSEKERLGVETFVHRRVEAILFTTPMDGTNVQLALDAGIPVVQVERPRIAEANKVIVDNYTGAVAAMEHLIQLGHRRIAFIGKDAEFQGNPIWRYVERERLSAYVDTLKKYDLPIDKSLIALGWYYYLENGGAAGDGRRLTDQILAQERPPTAIFASCDLIAVGVLQSIYAHGLRVPADISVVGFDDTYAAYLAPPLTTVKLPMHELGRVAVQIAIDQIEDGERDPHAVRTERLQTELVVRDSTGPVGEI